MFFFKVILSLIFAVSFSISCFTNVPSRITVLPENYLGVVIIVFDPSSRKEPLIRNGQITYEIPESGILFVDSPPIYQFLKDEYFYQTTEGARQKIRYLYPAGGSWKDKDVTFDNVHQDSAEVFSMVDELGTMEIKGKTVIYRSFLVGMAKDVDTLANQVQKKLDEVF